MKKLDKLAESYLDGTLRDIDESDDEDEQSGEISQI